MRSCHLLPTPPVAQNLHVLGSGRTHSSWTRCVHLLCLSPVGPFPYPTTISTPTKVNDTSEVVFVSQSQEKPGFAVLRGGSHNSPVL